MNHQTDNHGRFPGTALGKACRSHDPASVNWLLEHDADPNPPLVDHTGIWYQPLTLAIMDADEDWEESLEISKVLLAHGAAILPGMVSEAVRNDHPLILDLLLDHGGNPNDSHAGLPAIHRAARRDPVVWPNAAAMLESLLRSGADPNLRSATMNDGLEMLTPLGAILENASIEESSALELIRPLIAHGADPERPQRGGDGNNAGTPYEWAQERGWMSVVSLFEAHMSQDKAEELMQALVDYSSDVARAVNQKTHAEESALDITVELHRMDVAEYLLKSGADPRLPGFRGESPLDTAKSQGMVSFLDLVSSLDQERELTRLTPAPKDDNPSPAGEAGL